MFRHLSRAKCPLYSGLVEEKTHKQHKQGSPMGVKNKVLGEE